jgi:hypothetical protein
MPGSDDKKFEATSPSAPRGADETEEGLRAMQEMARSRSPEEIAKRLAGPLKALGDAAQQSYLEASRSGALDRALEQRREREELRSGITKAIESSEKTPVAESKPVVHKTRAERSFAVAVTTYGAVFATGLLQLAARDWYFGPIFTVGGGLA